MTRLCFDEYRRVRRERVQGVFGSLSARQAEIATLIASGLSNRAIAEMLFVSTRTVDTHVLAIFDKLEVRTRVELTALVIRGSQGQRAGTERPALPPLVGRDGDITAIGELLATHRVVTVVGAGGIGKTQAALRVLEGFGTDAGIETWVLELGPITSEAHIPRAIAQSIGISLSEADETESLVRQLTQRRAVLLLDTCEHVLDAAGTIAAAIVNACHHIRILATSREPLRISAERRYRLAPLAVPDLADSRRGLRVADAAKYSAIELFIERARAHDDRFAVTDATMPVLADICRRLDGVPLAIELAAGRIDHFLPAQILEHVEDHFEMLRSSVRDRPTRHESMNALIDWSYENLREEERALFRKLSIFSGPFALDGAMEIGKSGQGESVIELLASLVDKSLVMVDRNEDSLRYRLLDSTRVYARRKLAEAGEVDGIGARHVRYLERRFAIMRARSHGFSPPQLYAGFSSELADIRAALDAAYDRGDYEAGAKLLAAIDGCWLLFGLDREGVERFETFSSALRGTPASFVLLATLTDILGATGRIEEAKVLARRALEEARTLDDPFALASSLEVAASFEDRLEVIDELLSQVEAIDHGCPKIDIWVGLRRALVWGRSQQCDLAEARLRKLLSLCRAVDDRPYVGELLMRLAINAFFRGESAYAASLAIECVETVRPFGNATLLALQLGRAVWYLCASGDVRSAEDAAREALTIQASINPRAENVAASIEALAFVHALDGDLTRAALLSAFASTVFARTGVITYGARSELRARVEDLYVARLPESDLAALRRRGALLSAEDAIETALSR